MHYLYATCSSGMLGYVITNRKRVTLRNTRINAGVLDGALSFKLRLRGMAFTCISQVSFPHPPSRSLSLSLSLSPSFPPSLPPSLSLSSHPPSLLSVNHFMSCKDVYSLTYTLYKYISLCHWYSTTSSS